MLGYCDVCPTKQLGLSITQAHTSFPCGLPTKAIRSLVLGYRLFVKLHLPQHFKRLRVSNPSFCAVLVAPNTLPILCPAEVGTRRYYDRDLVTHYPYFSFILAPQSRQIRWHCLSSKKVSTRCFSHQYFLYNCLISFPISANALRLETHSQVQS